MKSLCTALPGAHIHESSHAGLRHALCFMTVAWLGIGFFIVPVLPVEAGWENGWIENLQLAVLVAGAMMAALHAVLDRQRGASRAAVALAACLVPVWLLLMGRELSWGAALLTPVGMGDNGPEYSSSVLWYKPAVAPAVVMLLVVTGGILAWFRVERLVWALLRACPFPWFELGLGVAAALLSTYGEGHLFGMVVSPHWGHNAAVLEEWAEVAAYLALLLAQWQLLEWAPRVRHKPPAADTAFARRRPR